MSNQKNGVTIRDIAGMCGVSISTVSNVLNGKLNKVSAEVAQKVLDAVNVLARNLRSASSKSIGVIVEDLFQFTTPYIIEGLTKCCEEKGYTLLYENMRLFGRWDSEWMHNSSLFEQSLNEVCEKMEALNVDGVIYIGSHEHKITLPESFYEIPTVVAYASTAGEVFPSYNLNDIKGGYDVCKYLLAMGHTKIAIVAGEFDNIHTVNRMKGFQRALFEAGIPFDPEMIVYRNWIREEGYDGMKELLENNRDITAVFAMSDLIAVGVYDCLVEEGYVIGKDISVIGYDDQNFASFMMPQLTTVGMPLEEIGYRSAKRLINMLRDEDNEDEDMVSRLDCTIMERDSVCAV